MRALRTLRKGLCLGFLLNIVLTTSTFAQKALTWQQVRDKFEALNPTLRAGLIGIDESRASEITAHLRPNPSLAMSADGIQAAPYQRVWQPLVGATISPNLSYLHERRHKRELRLESAQKATGIAISSQADLQRTLLSNLRAAFVQVLQEKAVFARAKENIAYYDHVLDVNRERYKAGASAQVDFDRLQLQRVTYEADLQNAEESLETAKIQLLTLLNDRTPVDEFDVTGPYDFSAQANGSTDPTFAAWWTYNPSFNNPFDHETVGASVSIPLHIFDRNHGEKLRTRLDIDRNEQLAQATRAQVFSDVDSAYATVESTLILLQPYKDKYLELASRVRDTIAFSYEHGSASLLDFLNAQADYRTVQVSYLNLVASYLDAANQLNQAVGREVIP